MHRDTASSPNAPYSVGATSQGGERFQDDARHYDALLLVSFGGPEGMEEVMPFLENVLRGRNVPQERMLEVAHHYEQFGGISPINEQNRALIAAVQAEFAAQGLDLPIYWGNRNWHPLIPDALEQMKADGVQRAICFFTSMFSCYSGCRQYRENLFAAQQQVENAPELERLRLGYNHPLFIEANADHLRQALAQLPPDQRQGAHVLFTAHSIPQAMADRSQYVAQLTESARLVAEMVGIDQWQLCYQSRSGAPHIPWLEPDVNDVLSTLHDQGVQSVVVLPIGFISDHMEVKFDLDTEAQQSAGDLGMTLVRASTVGTHPAFVRMIYELLVERMSANPTRPVLGTRPPNHDVCPVDCCLPR